jgi:hypothetical protein
MGKNIIELTDLAKTQLQKHFIIFIQTTRTFIMSIIFKKIDMTVVSCLLHVHDKMHHSLKTWIKR